MESQEKAGCCKCDKILSQYFEAMCDKKKATSLRGIQNKWETHFRMDHINNTCTLCKCDPSLLNSLLDKNIHAVAHMCCQYEMFISSSDGSSNRVNYLVDRRLQEAIKLLNTNKKKCAKYKYSDKDRKGLITCLLCKKPGRHTVGIHHTFPYQEINEYTTIIDHLVEKHHRLGFCNLCGFAIDKARIFVHMNDHIRMFIDNQEEQFLQPGSADVTKRFHESLQKNAQSNKKQKISE